MTKKHPHKDTTLTLAPLSVDEALAALLKTPPPKAAPTKEEKRRPKGRKRV
jgi:hypothetical protein